MGWLDSSTKGTGDEEKFAAVFIRYYGATIHSEIKIRPMAGQPEHKMRHRWKADDLHMNHTTGNTREMTNIRACGKVTVRISLQGWLDKSYGGRPI